MALALALASKTHGLGLGLGLEPAGLEPIPVLYAVLLSVKIIEGTENAALMYFVRYDMMSYFNVC